MMFITSALLLTVICSGVGAGSIPSQSKSLGFRVHIPKAVQAPSPNAISTHVLNLKRSSHASKSSKYLRWMRDGQFEPGYGATSITDLYGQEYIAEIKWGHTKFDVVVDTGSSDTWVVQKGFQCLDINFNHLPEAACAFGPPFRGKFDGGPIPNELFYVAYGDGEFGVGSLGYEAVTVAGIKVKHQEVGLVNATYWFGDGVTSGLMGLAYPYLTNAYVVSHPAGGNETFTFAEYDPIFTTMVKQNLILPLFSIAGERDSGLGYLAFGGLPPVPFTHNFSSTPLLMVEIYDNPAMLTEYSFYTIIADAYIYTGRKHAHVPHRPSGRWMSMFQGLIKNATQFPVIVDSGSTLTYLPDDLAVSVLAQYDPPARFSKEVGGYAAPCNAKVPEFGIEIGGTVFWVNEADMLRQGDRDSRGRCVTGVQPGGEGPFTLGDTFLNNVVAVFDVGAGEMRFAAHTY